MEALGIDPKTGSEKAATNRLNMYRKQLVTHLIQAGPEKKVAKRIEVSRSRSDPCSETGSSCSEMKPESSESGKR